MIYETIHVFLSHIKYFSLQRERIYRVMFKLKEKKGQIGFVGKVRKWHNFIQLIAKFQISCLNAFSYKFQISFGETRP